MKYSALTIAVCSAAMTLFAGQAAADIKKGEGPFHRDSLKQFEGMDLKGQSVTLSTPC